MPDSAVCNPPAAKTRPVDKVGRAHSYLGLVSTALGVCGALGTLFVWLVASFYVGDVEVRPDKNAEALVVKAYNSKGQEATFHTRRFQLMPGTYHLEITADGGATKHADTEVKFNKMSVVPVVINSPAEGQFADRASDAGQQTTGRRHHHWWQFWRY